jgi:predicted regulator of Ras-like GTPase activity (Roadblock/LC7/MglB family)
MFGFLKNMFRRSAETPIAGSPRAAAPAFPPPLPVPSRSPTPTFAPRGAASSAVVDPPTPAQVPVRTPVGGNGSGNGNGAAPGNAVRVSLQSIIDSLPAELKSKVRQSDVGDMMVVLPLEKVLSQLARGLVKFSFAEVRQMAPHVFSSDTDRDQTPVTMPLNEILARLNPALLVRKQNRKQIEVPDEIRSPFGENGQGLTISTGTVKPEAPAPMRHAAPPASSHSMPSFSGPARGFTPPPSPAHTVPPGLGQPAPRVPISPISPAAPGALSSPIAPRAPITPPPTSTPASSPGYTPGVSRPVSGPAPIVPISPALRNLAPTSPPPAPASAAPATGSRPTSTPATTSRPSSAPATSAKPSDETHCFFVPLATLSESWPEAVRLEIAQLGLGGEQVALPVEMVEAGLKRGKVTMQWKAVRAAIRPAPAPSISVHDGATLELPLKALAPLFLSRQKGGVKAQQKVGVDESIPNLFFGFPQAPETPPPTSSGLSHPVTKPVDTNYYTKEDAASSSGEATFKPKTTPSTDFLTRCATPNEVVSRAAAMDGVSGALIALPDGLMVASRLAPDLNGDTLAAFLPQIFGKVSQCTKELRMGELNNLNFTVGNVPWKIFRVNAIFFAAFGRPNEALPTAQLAALAAELDRKNK